jgi:hypothetical protein
MGATFAIQLVQFRLSMISLITPLHKTTKLCLGSNTQDSNHYHANSINMSDFYFEPITSLKQMIAAHLHYETI